MDHIDLGPACATVAAVVRGVGDDQLAGPTPCPELSVAAMLDHLHGLSLAFVVAATREFDQLGFVDGAPEPSADSLVPDWRTAVPARLDELAAAWRSPAAWEGMTKAGGVDLPAEVCGLVALNEVVIHGWDLAAATGQPYPVDEATAATVHEFVAGFEAPDGAPDDNSLFGPPVEVPETAPALDQALGRTGRTPTWHP